MTNYFSSTKVDFIQNERSGEVGGEDIKAQIFGVKERRMELKVKSVFIPRKMQTFWQLMCATGCANEFKGGVNEGHANSRLRPRIKAFKARREKLASLHHCRFI